MASLDASEMRREDALHTTTDKPVVFPTIQKPIITAERYPGYQKSRTTPGCILMTDIH